MSIVASGFFPYEPLIVACEDGENIVIEGNRRLAAVKLLLDTGLAQTLELDIPAITEDAKLDLQELPVVLDTREEAWRYLGFKHVNGPVKWSSYAKSIYIAEVHRRFGIPLEEIAKQIGDTHKTVQRLFRALMVIEQAERLQVFSREDRWNKRFASSHLYTGLDYTGISSFIGLRSESDEDPDPEPVPPEKGEELGELLRWMYGSKRDDIRPIIRSQNPDLRHFNAVVANREAVAALRAGNELARAFEISRPSSNVFEESLHAAKRDLEKAHSMLSTGYDGSQQLLMVADDVATLASDLYEAMYRKRNPQRERHAARTG